MHQGPYNKQVCATYPHGRNFQAQVPASSERLSKIDCPTTDEEKAEIDYPYINVTGSLLYTTICTRPDLFFAVMQLARFNSNPGKEHIKASKMTISYLESTVEQGIRFTKKPSSNGKLRIQGFVDSDWAGCPDTRRSTMGYIIHVSGGPVSFKSKGDFRALKLRRRLKIVQIIPIK